MKRKLLLIPAVLLPLLCSCTKNTEPQAEEDLSGILFACFEDPGTKTYVDDALHLLWTKDDLLSVFEGNTYNHCYRFLGNTGDNYGNYKKIKPEGLISQFDLDEGYRSYYAVYPYNEDASISYDGILHLTLPSLQHYAPGSFGLEDNTMVAVTDGMEDNVLRFKNIGGYLLIKLYADDETVRSVTVSTANKGGEPLAGNADVTARHGSLPTYAYTSGTSQSITVDCGEDGVRLGTSAAEPTVFWFVIPPVTLSHGFELTITNTDGLSVTKSASAEKTILRNTISTMTALKVAFSNPPQSYSQNGIDNLEESGFDW